MTNTKLTRKVQSNDSSRLLDHILGTYTYTHRTDSVIGIKRIMADKFIYIPNDDKQNYSFCRLQLEVVTFGYSK